MLNMLTIVANVERVECVARVAHVKHLKNCRVSVYHIVVNYNLCNSYMLYNLYFIYKAKRRLQDYLSHVTFVLKHENAFVHFRCFQA